MALVIGSDREKEILAVSLRCSYPCTFSSQTTPARRHLLASVAFATGNPAVRSYARKRERCLQDLNVAIQASVRIFTAQGSIMLIAWADYDATGTRLRA